VKLEIGLTDGPANTCYAPLAVLCAYYQDTHALESLSQVLLGMKIRSYSCAEKLIQVFLSMLAGCQTLSEVNSKLKGETQLAAVWGWQDFADQSSLSRTLDALQAEQIDQLRLAENVIWRAHSQVPGHDWRNYLWLEYDQSGLPCSLRAQESQKGWFSGDKKMFVAAS
jgi:hypothetical protein